MNSMTERELEVDRVRRNTDNQTLSRIDQQIEDRIKYYQNQPPEVIERRISELDMEWDTERVLETNASSLALAGLVLGTVGSRRWFWLTGGVLGFLLQHAIQGWCPPLPMIRLLGVRTRSEIDREKFALMRLLEHARKTEKAA